MTNKTIINRLLFATIPLLLCLIENVKAQSSSTDDFNIEDFSAELDAILSDSGDSLGIFQLLDSLLAISETPSQLSLRLGYSSRVTSAGRDFGIDQQGLSPGISFYHKSGLYGDLTGVWNSDFDPNYNLTITTLGYLGNIGKRWSYSISYDHSFFHTKDELQNSPLTNSLGASASLDFKHVYTGIDYSFSFGTESAHRIMWNLSGYIKLRPFGPFKSITLLPSFGILWGNQSIVQSYFNVNRFRQIKNLTLPQLRSLAQSGEYTQDEIATIILLRNLVNRSDLTTEQRATIKDFFTAIEDFDTFGLMNYNLSVPISFNAKKFGVIISYNYNIPVELTGSQYVSESNGYLSCTLSYNIGL